LTFGSIYLPDIKRENGAKNLCGATSAENQIFD
jgi:hypothetical protein